MGKQKKPVLRTCVVCREQFPKAELIRYVCPTKKESVGASGLVPDPDQKREGRGFYTCTQEQCQMLFEKKARGLKKRCKGEDE